MARIIFLNNQGLASFGGGVTILRELARALAGEHEIAILSFDDAAAGWPAIRQIRLPAFAAGRLWRFAPLLRARHLQRVTGEWELAAADLVIALDCHFALALGQARPRRLLYLSLSCIPRQQWFASRGGGGAMLEFLQYAWLERKIARSADAVVVASAVHASDMRRFELLPRLRPRVIHPVFAAPAPAGRRQGTNEVVILSAGRLDPVKNYQAVIDLAVRLRDLPCRFVLAGEGGEAVALRARAEASGLADRIAFPGRVEATAALLAEADLFLHPSRYESFGIAVVEAMQAGLPVIGSRTGPCGYREILRDGVDACLVDFARPDEAAAAIRALVTDPARRRAMGEAARRTAERLLARPYVDRFREMVAQSLGMAA